VSAWGTVLGWVFTHALGQAVSEADAVARSMAWLDEWLLGRVIAGLLQELGLSEQEAWRGVDRVRVLIAHQGWLAGDAVPEASPREALSGWLRDEATQRFIGLHRFDGTVWFHKESLEELLDWMLVGAAIGALATADLASEQAARLLGERARVVRAIRQAVEASGYRLDALLEGLPSAGTASTLGREP